MSLLELKKMSKIYNKDGEGVKSIDLNIKQGDFVSLLGPSGCGKTTTLRAIGGLEEITGGEIIIDGKVSNDVPPQKRDISMVFQSYALFPHLTVENNLAFGLKIRKVSEYEKRSKVNRIAKLLKIEELLHRKPSELSGGQKQRVALGRALILEPKILLLDEPLSNLDSSLRTHMMTELKILHEEIKNTIIYVTHNQLEAISMSDKVVLMDKGKIVQIDSPKKIYKEPINMFASEFIGEPKINSILGIIEKEVDTLLFISGSLKVKISKEHYENLSKFIGKKVYLGVRPDDIDIVSGKYDSKRKSDTVIKSKILITENMGNHNMILFKIEDVMMSLLTTMDMMFDKGKDLDIIFNARKFYFFDEKTEENILL